VASVELQLLQGACTIGLFARVINAALL
jgi:hypothetical protein